MVEPFTAEQLKKKLWLKTCVLCVSARLKWLLFCLLIFSSNYLENPHVFLLSKLLKLVTLEMLEDIEGAGLEAGTLEHAHISMFLKKKQKLSEVMILKKRFFIDSRVTTKSTGTPSQKQSDKKSLESTKQCWVADKVLLKLSKKWVHHQM